MKNHLVKIAIFCFALSLLLASCREEPANGEYELERAFRPYGVSRDAPVEDEVTISWTPILDCTYQLEISADSMVFERGRRTFQLPRRTSEFKLDGLWAGERHSLRIKAIHEDPDVPDSEWAYIATPTFMAPTLGILLENANIATLDQVTIRWNPAKQVDRIAISVDNVEVGSFTLTEEEKDRGEKTINTELASGTEHYFMTYRGDAPIGRSIRTTAVAGIFSAVATGDIASTQVTLRWIADQPATRISVLLEGVEIASEPLNSTDITAMQKTITGLTAGTTYIFQIFNGDMRRGERTVTTIGNPESVEIEDEVVIRVGISRTMTAIVLPAASNQNVTWDSDHPAVAGIDPNTGILTGVAGGTATITATTVDGGLKATCIVRVIAATDNLLKNGSFEAVSSTGNAFDFDDWVHVPAGWYTAYYPGNGGEAPATPTNAIFSRQGAATFDPPSPSSTTAPYFKAEGYLDGTFGIRLNVNQTGGLYQEVPVTPGRRYWFKANFGFHLTNVNQQTIKEYETLKILSVDDPDDPAKTHAEVLIIPPGTHLALGNYDPATNPEAYIVSQATGIFTVPAGVTKVRFQIDFRNFASNPNRGPYTVFDACEFCEVPE